MHQSSIEVIETIMRFHWYCFMKLSQGIVDLVQHHHTISSVGVVLSIISVKTNSCSEIVHCLLIVTNSHESLPSFWVISSMRWSLIVIRSRLQAGDSLTKLLNGIFSISFIFLFCVFGKIISSFIVKLRSKFLLLNLISVIRFFRLLSLGLRNILLHNNYY